jgi:hypothetical protein
MNTKLKKLLSEEYILKMTQNNINIEEGTDQLYGFNTLPDVVSEIKESNLELWAYLSELAEAQGIVLPEYQG